MWKSKKFIIISLVTAVVLVAGIGVAVFAQTDNGDDNNPEARHAALLEEVCAIYQENTGVAINCEELATAFEQAQSKMREGALDRYLQKLVDEGQITEAEAEQFRNWWQSRPDMEPYRHQLQEWHQARPGMPEECQEWQESRPDIPLPRQFRPNPGFRGFQGGPRMWGGQPIPPPAE